MRLGRITISLLSLVGASDAFSQHVSLSSQRRHSYHVLKQSIQNDSDDVEQNMKHKNGEHFPNRREALVATASALLSTSGMLTPANVNALDLPFGSSSSSEMSSGYQQAKRATAYLVDSTIPPTLVPFRAMREAAILKQLGSGSGTQKSPFVEEGLNLNNFMKKSVYGSIDAISSLVNPGENTEKGPTFCFLALPELEFGSKDDVDLAGSLLDDLLKPRRSSLKSDTALGLSFIPKLSGQPILDQYLLNGDEQALVDRLTTESQLSSEVITQILPLVQYARTKGVPLLALGPEQQDLFTVRTQGLQNLDVDRRSKYVLDTAGFIATTQDPKFKLYADRSLLKDWVPLENSSNSADANAGTNAKRDGPGDFFAQRILEDETIATSISQWAVLRPESFIVVISDIPHARYFGGANGRVPRIMKFLNNDSVVDDESVTTILINPTAQVCLHLSVVYD